MLGAAGGFASAVIMRRALVLPADEARVVRGLGPILAKMSATGVAILWVTGLIHMTYVEIRKGNVVLAARLPKLGPMAGVSALLAVLFAVVAFG
jgi:hypothetical protein